MTSIRAIRQPESKHSAAFTRLAQPRQVASCRALIPSSAYGLTRFSDELRLHTRIALIRIETTGRHMHAAQGRLGTRGQEGEAEASADVPGIASQRRLHADGVRG